MDTQTNVSQLRLLAESPPLSISAQRLPGSYNSSIIESQTYSAKNHMPIQAASGESSAPPSLGVAEPTESLQMVR